LAAVREALLPLERAGIVQSGFDRIIAATRLAPSNWLLEKRQTSLKMRDLWERALAFHSISSHQFELGNPDAVEQDMALHIEQTIEVYWKAVNR
jgi:hypothetical protein